MPPLTRIEAEARATLLTVHRASVEVDLREPGADTFTSSTRIDFGCAEPGAGSFVDIAPERLLRATLNGTDLPPESLSEQRLQLPGLLAENTLEVVGEMAYSNDGEGLHRHLDPADDQPYLYAMSFLDAGPRWFASFDQPDLKCPYLMRVHTPPDWTVLGNGRFTETEPGDWRLTEETPPLASYFVTLVAGPYVSVHAEHDGIRLGVHTRASLAPELAAESEDILRVTGQAFDAYHELFQRRYAFGDYHQVFVPDFNAGAMENPGCVTLRDQYLFRGSVTDAERGHRAGTLVHELAHQWFGDLVTMSWWDDLWLNESFAELMAHWVCSDFTDYPLWVEFGIQRKDWGAIADQGPASHPVAGNGAADAQQALAQFDGISYAKGAGVLKQLVATITPEVFLAGLRDYFDRYAHGNARFVDLLACWQRAGASELPAWADAWLNTSGMDLLRAEQRAGRSGVLHRHAGAAGERTHTVQLVSLAADAAEQDRVEVTATSEETPLELPDGFWVPDAGDETWARIRPSAPVEQWPPLAAVTDPMLRVVLWNSLRDQVRAAEVDPAVALDVVTGQLADEPDDVVVTAILAWAHGVLAGPYAAPADRAPRLHRLAELAQRLLDGAAPGSDRQLVAWRGLLRCTDDVAQLAAWLDGAPPPPGLELDAELRWAAVWRLATLAAGESALDRARAAIAEAYRLDRSASGRVHRARALASLPDPEAKEEAFWQLMRPSQLSAYELYATAEGFFAPEQAELTEPYVQRFFAGINSTAAFRRGWSLSRLALQAFPASASRRATLELAEQTLATEDLDPRLRRPLLEATDQLRRAVTSLEKYAPSAATR
ncbi:aminopeptidase N [Enemella evansiae]|uniref:aminopeptidase N n=1 Tax=Enemella evansiae TaxID=2016499 RepID=UPI000B9654A1|nr:aminopeptidase N [Enemella evansiae]OYO08192.1 aminopeptidase N [Enemella evansiae]